MGTGGEFRPPSGFLPAGEIGICCSTLRRQRPKGLCQRERGTDALVSVVVIEDREQGAIHRKFSRRRHPSVWCAVRLREKRSYTALVVRTAPRWAGALWRQQVRGSPEA